MTDDDYSGISRDPATRKERGVLASGRSAAALKRKRDAGTGSAEQLAEINADLAAMHAAHAADANRVTPVDASRPNRHFDWLTPEEYSAAATAASQKLNAHRVECNNTHARF